MEEKDLLGYSQDVLRFEKALEVRYEGYYERLAAQQELSAEEQAVLRAEVTQETETPCGRRTSGPPTGPTS